MRNERVYLSAAKVACDQLETGIEYGDMIDYLRAHFNLDSDDLEIVESYIFDLQYFGDDTPLYIN